MARRPSYTLDANKNDYPELRKFIEQDPGLAQKYGIEYKPKKVVPAIGVWLLLAAVILTGLALALTAFL